MVRSTNVGKAKATAGTNDNLGRLMMLAIGAVIGFAAGVMVAPTTGRNARARVAQKSGKLARRTARRTVTVTRYAASTAAGRASGAVSRLTAREQEVEPETIADRVRTELGQDADLRHLPSLNVNAEPGGVVYLRGALPTDDLRTRAENIARGVRGVQTVVNEVEVVTSASVRTGQPAPEEITELSRKVEAAIRQDSNLSYLDPLEVRQDSAGILYLRGTVHSEEDRERAESIARGVEGVSTVINDLAVVSPGPDVIEGQAAGE